jgi:exodeoxyribonuclease-3
MTDVVDWGFTDIFRKHHPEPGQYTFWDYRSKVSFAKNLGWRIDHIMATESVAKKSSTSYVDKTPRTMPRPSDHAPIVAEFDI